MKCNNTSKIQKLNKNGKKETLKRLKMKSNNKPKVEKLNKTDAKKTFFLSDRDLKDIPYIEKRNPQNSNPKYMIKMFEIKELTKISKKKYKCKTKRQLNEVLGHLSIKRENTNMKRKNTINRNKEKRKCQIIEALHRHGLELRKDSKLCEGYIQGRIKDKDLNWIANRMCEMKFLFEFCDMKSAFDSAKEDWCNDYFHDGWKLLDFAEIIALEEVGGYPSIFPWLSTPNPQTERSCKCDICKEINNIE